MLPLERKLPPGATTNQAISSRVQATIYHALHSLMALEVCFLPKTPTGFDGGPVIEGAIGAILCVAAEGSASDEDLRRQINAVIDTVLPQIRMHQAANVADAGAQRQ